MTLPQLNQFELKRLHSIFASLTSSEVRWDIGGYVESLWFNWHRAGYTESDLRLVVGAIRSGIGRGVRNPGALKFKRLIEDLVNFGDELAEAKTNQRALERQVKPTPRQKILTAIGRPEAKPDSVVPIGAVTPKTDEEWRAFFQACRAKEGL